MHISIKEIQLDEFLNFLYGKIDSLLIKTFMLGLEEEDIKNYIKWNRKSEKSEGDLTSSKCNTCGQRRIISNIFIFVFIFYLFLVSGY